MKNNLRMIIMLGVFALFIGCASTNFAQTDGGNITGGYAAANVKDKEVIATANFAVKAIAKKQKSAVKLISINSAELQVVAGINYRLCLSVNITKNHQKKAESQTLQTIVYQNLKQKLNLTSWKITPCAVSTTF